MYLIFILLLVLFSNISENLRVSVQPATIVDLPGANIHIQCIANIHANFTWLHNGRLLPSKTSSFQTTSGLLMLRNISAEMEGQVTCVAMSNAGIFAASAELIVGGK